MKKQIEKKKIITEMLTIKEIQNINQGKSPWPNTTAPRRSLNEKSDRKRLTV